MAPTSWSRSWRVGQGVEEIAARLAPAARLAAPAALADRASAAGALSTLSLKEFAVTVCRGPLGELDGAPLVVAERAPKRRGRGAPPPHRCGGGGGRRRAGGGERRGVQDAARATIASGTRAPRFAEPERSATAPRRSPARTVARC